MRTFFFAATIVCAGCQEYQLSSGLDRPHGDLTEADTPPDQDAETNDDSDPTGGSAIRRSDDYPDDDLPDDDDRPDDDDNDNDRPDDDDDDDDSYGDRNGRMTGGGSVWDDAIRVTHGFTLRCDLDRAQHLQINWEDGQKFHLTELVSVACWDDPALDPESPNTQMDTLWAIGTGTFGGTEEVVIELLITDDGEPGDTDEASFVIDGGDILDVASAVDLGNHQAHGDPTMRPPSGAVPTVTELEFAGLDAPTRHALDSAGCRTTPAGGLGALGMFLALLGLRTRRT